MAGWMKLFAKRKDTRADTAVADGRYGELQMTANGDLRVKDEDANTDLDAIVADLAELTSAPVEKTPVKVTQFVAAASTAEALVASQTFAKVLHLQARKVDGDNTGNVFIGLSDLDQGAAELFELTPGATQELVMPAGDKVDLNNIYVDADNNDDGVVGWYIPA